jgi:putative FmdB family regulatory protein
MPIYVYEPTLFSPEDPVSTCCYFESLQSINESPLTTCPTCGAAVHRAISAFSFSTKGNSAKGETQMPGGILGKQNSADTASGRAARLAMRHVCSGVCKH